MDLLLIFHILLQQDYAKIHSEVVIGLLPFLFFIPVAFILNESYNTNPGCKSVQGTTVMIKVVKGAKPANVKPLLFIYGAAGEGN